MNGHLLNALVAAAAFSLLGIVLMALVFLLMVKISPFSIRKEIEEDQNISVGIVIGSIMVSVGLIVAAAVHS
jgi:putative membrane protein